MYIRVTSFLQDEDDTTRRYRVLSESSSNSITLHFEVDFTTQDLYDIAFERLENATLPSAERPIIQILVYHLAADPNIDGNTTSVRTKQLNYAS